MQNQINLAIKDINPFLRCINLYRCRPGFKSGVRKLYSYYFLYVHKGKGVFAIGDRRYNAMSGDLFFCQPGVSNSITADAEDPFLLTGVEFDFTHNNIHKKLIFPIQEELFQPSYIAEFVKIIDFEGFPDRMSLPEDKIIRGKIYDMINEYNLKKSHWNEYVNGILLTFIILAIQRVEQQGAGIKNISKGDEIIQFLTENYMDNLTNNQIAARFHYHPDYINKIVCTYTGITLKQYIIDLRIRAALAMLVHSDKDITNIASAVGYENLQYFYRVFRKKTGLSPGYFRRNITNTGELE